MDKPSTTITGRFVGFLIFFLFRLCIKEKKIVYYSFEVHAIQSYWSHPGYHNGFWDLFRCVFISRLLSSSNREIAEKYCFQTNILGKRSGVVSQQYFRVIKRRRRSRWTNARPKYGFKLTREKNQPTLKNDSRIRMKNTDRTWKKEKKISTTCFLILVPARRAQSPIR